VRTSKKIAASSDLVHGTDKRAGASPKSIDATGRDARATNNNVAETIESDGATAKSDQ
jgi:hypothetical protein